LELAQGRSVSGIKVTNKIWF